MLNHLDMERDLSAIWAANNRSLDNKPIVKHPPLIFKRGYYGTTDYFGDDYRNIRGGYIRYYPSNIRPLDQQYYNLQYKRFMDIRQPVCQSLGWSQQLDDERLQKAWLLNDYSTFLNRHEYFL
jgi:hypothetical protein